MQIWGLLLTRLALVILAFNSRILSQYEFIENFDPENSLPESDLIIMSTAGSIYQKLTPESALLLSQLSFLTNEENSILEQIVLGNSIEISSNTRLLNLTKTLWPRKTDLQISGTVFHRINMGDDVQYKWSAEFNLNQFNFEDEITSSLGKSLEYFLTCVSENNPIPTNQFKSSIESNRFLLKLKTSKPEWQ